MLRLFLKKHFQAQIYKILSLSPNFTVFHHNTDVMLATGENTATSIKKQAKFTIPCRGIAIP